MRGLASAGHLSWAVIDAVGELDLSEFLAYYRSDGRAARPTTRR